VAQNDSDSVTATGKRRRSAIDGRTHSQSYDAFPFSLYEPSVAATY
jgi:hypothetical protein